MDDSPANSPGTAKILVVGSVAYDDIQTPRGHSGRVLGGSASYAALAASFFCRPQLVGVVGYDFARTDIELLRQHGVDLEGLQIRDDGETFYWAGRYSNHFRTTETIETRLNVFESFSPDLPASYRKTRYILLGNIQPRLQARVLDQIKPGAFILADTRDLWINLAHSELLQLLPRVDLFLLNDDEASLLTRENNLIQAGYKLLDMGPKAVLIKKGAHGSMLFHPEGFFTWPAYPVDDLRDPTGAGDSFAGALLGWLATTGHSGWKQLKTAIVYGTAAASLTVEAFSVDGLLAGGRKAIETRFRELCHYTSIDLDPN